MDQAGLAREAGVDAKTVRALERGTRWPRDGSRVKIENALGWAGGSLDRIAKGDLPVLLDDAAQAGSATGSSDTPAGQAQVVRLLRDQLVAVASGIRSAASELGELAEASPKAAKVMKMLDELERYALLQSVTIDAAPGTAFASGGQLLHTQGTRLAAPGDAALEQYAAREAAERKHQSG